MRTDPVFNVGDEVVCIIPYGYNLSLNGQYEVLKYVPKDSVPNIGFTWPAYVTVQDDSGKKAVCHADRFKAVET